MLGDLLNTIEEDETVPLFDLERLSYSQAVATLPEFAQGLELWASKKGTAAVPDWADFDFVDFRGLHRDIVLSRFDADGVDPFFVLTGDTFVDVVKKSSKGLYFSECWPRLFDKQFRAHFSEIKHRGLIGFASGKQATKNRTHVKIRVLELPVRDGGADVGRIIHIVHLDKT